MWLGTYVVSKFLNKGAYELTNFEGNKLPEPRNGLYLKKYYAQAQHFFLYFYCMYFYVHQVVGFVFYTICWLLQMSSERYIGFADGTSRHTCNLASAAWVIYSPSGQLVATGGAFLGPASNNVIEYRAVIELLWDALSRGITQLEFRMDSQMVVSQLNRAYHVRNPILLRQFLQVRLVEINFDYISFNHIP